MRSTLTIRRSIIGRVFPAVLFALLVAGNPGAGDPPQSALEMGGERGAAAAPVSMDAMKIEFIPGPDGNWTLRGTGDAEVAHEGVSLKAAEVEVDYSTGTLLATGDVVFTDARGTIRAERLIYDINTGAGEVVQPVASHGPLVVRGDSATTQLTADVDATGHRHGLLRLLGASATACDREVPDYRMTARQIEMHSNGRVVARGVTFWLGNTRVFTLPRLAFKLSQDGAARRSLLPGIGFDGEDGAFLGLGFPVLSSDRSHLGFQIRGTSRQGAQGGVAAEYLLSGSASGELVPAVIDTMVELRALPLVRTIGEGDGLLPQAQFASPQVRLFANAAYRQKAYDIGADRLWVSRLPEVGLRYSGRPIHIGVAAVSSAMLSYSRISESPGLKDIGRFDARGLLSTHVIDLGHKTALQPAFFARYSSYDTGDAYRVLGGSINLAHTISKDSYASLRLIKYRTSGETPLEVDDIDIATELQGALWYRLGRNLVGLEVDYDLDRRRIVDWGITYGRTLHCLEPRLSWRNKFSTLGLDVKVLGF